MDSPNRALDGELRFDETRGGRLQTCILIDDDGWRCLLDCGATSLVVSMSERRTGQDETQAERLGLPLHIVEIPSPCPNAVYEARMEAAMDAARVAGIEHVVFGDLFLEDVRDYRERNLAGTGITPVFPLWDRPTGQLAREMLDAGVRAVLTCIDPNVLPSHFSGRAFDETLLADLPEQVDPCGERGEFHTFVWDGPGFSAPIDIEVGEIVRRDGFVFCDVLPAS